MPVKRVTGLGNQANGAAGSQREATQEKGAIQEEDATPVVVRPRALPSDPGLEMFDPDSLRARFELLSRPITEEEPAVPATDTEMMIEVRESINQGEIDSAISRMETAG